VKTSSSATGLKAGNVITYIFTATNTGNVTLTNVSVTDAKLGLSNLTLSPSTIAPGATATGTATYIITQADMDAGGITNTATVNAKDPGNSTVSDVSDDNSTLPNNQDPTVTPLTQDPKIALVKTSSSGLNKGVGDQITYTFTATNTGNVTLSNVSVSDAKLGLTGTSILSLTPSTLAPGATATGTATYTITQADLNTGSITNTATVSGTPPTGPAVTDISDNSSNSGSNATVTPLTQDPKIALVKTASSGLNKGVGETITYTFTATNTGNVTLTNVSVSDVKLGLTGTSILSLTPSTLAPGATATGTATYTITQADLNTGSITNTATVSGTPPSGSAVTDISDNNSNSENDPTVTPLTQDPKIALVKTSSSGLNKGVGETITYTFTATNTGNVTLTNVSVTDAKLGVSKLALTPSTLAPEATATGTATYTITQADLNTGSITNTATVSGTSPSGSAVTDVSDNNSNSENDPTVTPLTQDPKIALVKTSSSGLNKGVGQTIIYTFTAINTGNVTLSNVSITDAKLGLSNVALIPSTLTPGAVATGTATYTITQADMNAGSITNTAIVNAKDPLNRNVTDSSDNNSNSENDPTLTPLTQDPKIALVKTSSSGLNKGVGDQITYTFTATNTGNVTLTDVSVTDAKLGLSSFALTPSTLAPGATATGTATYAITQADINAGSITNTATVSGTPPSGSAVTDISDNSSNSGSNPTVTPLTQNPKIALVKTSSSGLNKGVGETITYTFTATNTGSVTLSNVSVTDAKLGVSNLALTPSTIAPGATASGTANYTITQADMNAGSITNTAIVSGTPPSGPAVTDVSDNSSNSGNNPTITPLTQDPKIALVKTASNASNKKAGDVITYTFKVKNTGNVILTNVNVTDAKLGLSNYPVTPSILVPGDSATGSANYTIKEADMVAGTIVNTATAYGTAPGGSIVSDISDSSSVNGSGPTIVILPKYPPDAVNDSASTPKNTPVTVDIKANDKDPDNVNAELTPSITVQPRNGTAVMGADGKLIYTPRNNFTGKDTVTYKLCDPTGLCDTAIVVITIIPVAEPSDIIVSDTAFCTGGTGILTASSTTIPNPVFRWYGDAGLTNLLFVGNTFVTPQLVTTTKYYVAVSGSGVLPNVANNGKVVTVTVYPQAVKPVISAGGATALCPGGSVVLSSSAASSYQWYKDGVAIAGATLQTYTASAIGIYSVVTTNANGCKSANADGVTVSNAVVPQAPVVTASGLSFCVGSGVSLTSSASAGNQWYRDGVAIAGATGNTLSVTTSGTYTVQVTNSSGCISAFGNAVTVSAVALPSAPVLKIDGTVRFCADDSRMLSVSIPQGSTIQWFRNGAALSAGAAQDTLRVKDGASYSVRIVNASGCQSALSNIIQTEVNCKEVISFPDIFTPNGDGINETIRPSIPGIRKFRCFKVYNRWGNLVFETTDASRGWDGKFRGSDQPADTYIWLVEGADTAGKEVKRTGMFTLIR
jgi:gliding motility-associated-like protein/uncharacterized repeat protein (TIGR01451 family)